MMTLVKYIMTSLMLIYVYSIVDIKKLVMHLSEIGFQHFVFFLTLYFIAHFVNSYKWYKLLPSVPFFTLLKLTFIGQYFALFLPGQLAADGAKAYFLGRGKKNAETILTSVLMDKVTGLIGMFLLTIIGLYFASIDSVKIYTLPVFVAGGSMISVLFLIKLSFFEKLILKLLELIESLLPALCSITQRLKLLVKSWKGYAKKTLLLMESILIGAAFQLLAIYICYAVSVQLAINVNFVDWLWVFGMVSLIVLLPVSIAGIGVREVSLVYFLGVLGSTQEQAVALSFLLLAMQLAGGVVGFALFLFYKDEMSQPSPPS